MPQKAQETTKMKTAEKMIPDLRFPEFKGEWEEKRLGKEFPFIRNGFVGTATPYYAESGVKYLQGKNVKNGAISENCLIHITEAFHKKCQKSQLKNGDVLMVQSGHVGECALVTKEYEGANCHALLVLTPSDNIVSKFYIFYFYSSRGKRAIQKVKTGNTIEHILSSDLKPMHVLTPDSAEQKKIADFLLLVDGRIEGLEKKRELLAAYKKGLMQKLFNQSLRFENGNQPFPDWEEKRLGEVSRIRTGKLDANAMVDNGPYRFYTCAREYYRIDVYAFDTEALLISGNGANVGYIHYYKGRFNAYQRTYVLDLFEQNILFVKYFLSERLTQRIEREKKEGCMPYIVLGTLSEMKIPVPCLEEQRKIAECLSAVDRKIGQVETQVEQTRKFKQGLLQKMFV